MTNCSSKEVHRKIFHNPSDSMVFDSTDEEST